MNMKYNKLVRDNIPGILQKRGKIIKKHIADDKEYREKLLEKLQEEVDEFLESNIPDELADILEVLYAIAKTQKVDDARLNEIRKNKQEERGAFIKRIILDEVSNS